VAEGRADRAWATLRSSFIRPGRGEILEVREGPEAGRAPLWPTSQILAAAIDVGAGRDDLSDARGLARGLAGFRRGDAYAERPRRRRRYFDDNAWVGLELVRLHLRTGDPDPLADARRVFAFVAGGQDPDGAVRWVEGGRSRNACSTAPAAELALQLHLVEPDGALVRFARRAMGWLDGTLRLASGLIADHEDGGRVDPAVWSYNQGSALGAFALLHRAQERDADLDAAMRLAHVSLDRFRGETLWTHPPVFNAVWFRNLADLDAIAPVPGLADALDHYLDRVWRDGLDPDTGWFTRGGIGSYDGTPAIDHGGLTQLFVRRANA
jgi:hypothetical protein